MAKPPVPERPYETLFICPVDTQQKTVESFIEKVKSTLAQEKGTFGTLQVWGRRRMTYPIKRQKDGIYVYFDFNGSNKSTQVLNNLFHVSDFVLRHMTVLREDAPTPVPASSTFTEGSAESPSVTAASPSAAQTKESPSTSLGTGPSTASGPSGTSPTGTGPSTK